jgi:rhamnosyltransferase
MTSIFSVVVLFNPKPENLLNLVKISELSTMLFVIDNSDVVLDLVSIEAENIVYIKNEYNIGLDRALNIGIKKCLADIDCTHIALFDQDSFPGPKMFENLISILEICDDKVVAVSPQILDIKNIKNTHLNDAENVDIVITSGTLYPRNAFEKVGLMDETFFIDYIDYEWCLRAKSMNYKIVRVNNATLFHNMGDTFINFFGSTKPLHVNYKRHYYIIRNQLIFIFRPYTPLYYKVVHFLKLIYRIPAYIFFSDDKSFTVRLIIKAFKDYLSNREEYSHVKN